MASTDITPEQIADYVHSAQIDVASAGRTRLSYSLRIQGYRVAHDGETIEVTGSAVRAAEVFNATVRKHS